MTQLDFNRFRIEPSPEALVQELEGEAVILDLASESYFGLDASAVEFWNAVQNSPNLEDAFRALLEKYDVDEETLRVDLNEFVHQLVERGLATLESV